ncbi:hypothetical protein ACH436_17455 [Isoptericola sp. NPDC019693]|uniref:hypothetical protein n=1 Tax=Isoptericola sp. NPDC019693 TaxID=3364009 RepID=UPI00378D9CC4
MSDNVRDLIREVAAEAEETRHEPLPADAVGTRPHSQGTQPRVLSVRLTGEQYDKLVTAAEYQAVPVSTLARMLIVQGVEGTGLTPPRATLSPEQFEVLLSHLPEDLSDILGTALRRNVKPEFLQTA